MKLTDSLKQTIADHAAQCYPRECCGVIIKNKGLHYIACRNDSIDAAQFSINAQDMADAEDMGKVVAYVHSHPDGSTRPSQADLVQIELHKKPWVICAYPDVDFDVHQPFGYSAPLLGRSYHHGILDCYSLMRDYYQRELNIALNDFDREDCWWEHKENDSLYLTNYQKEGFVVVDDLQRHDVLICRVGRTEHPNHACIYLGDNGHLSSEPTPACIGASLILHHPYGRKSVREICGANWQARADIILRHRELIK